jgi:hypothetical protein
MPDFTDLEPAGFRTELETLADSVPEVPAGNEDDLVALDVTGGLKAVPSDAYVATGSALHVVSEVDGTYQSRPPVGDVPNAIWIGESDATLEADFAEWNATTGVGDTWQEVPTE